MSNQGVGRLPIRTSNKIYLFLAVSKQPFLFEALFKLSTLRYFSLPLGVILYLPSSLFSSNRFNHQFFLFHRTTQIALNCAGHDFIPAILLKHSLLMRSTDWIDIDPHADRFLPKVVKEVKSKLSPHFATIFNASLEIVIILVD